MITSQLNRFTFRNKWSTNFFRSSSTSENSSKVLYPLKNRSLIEVSGAQVSQFLQGLITNDMKHFDEGAQSMYAMFLNNKGRILYDTLLHKWGGDNTFLIECDKNVNRLLQRHLNIYKLKKDIKISDASQLLNLWALITPLSIEEIFKTEDVAENVKMYKDPRLADLGFRVITTSDIDNFDLHYAMGRDTVIKHTDEDYHNLRYKLGISEGAEDLFPGTAFPLESNCDYLHGISFHKGCYIGQELTARIHHTGVVRKRLMPVQFLDRTDCESIEKDAPIYASVEPGKIQIGRLKNKSFDYGIALIKIKEALESKDLYVGMSPIDVVRPHWWPREAPKEKHTLLKSEYESDSN